MAALTVQKIVRTGLEPAALVAATAGGDTFANKKGKTFFRVKNAAAGAARTVTFVSQAAVPGQGLAAASLAVVVPLGGTEERWIGPFEPLPWNNAAGSVEVTYSDAGADLTVAAYELP